MNYHKTSIRNVETTTALMSDQAKGVYANSELKWNLEIIYMPV